MEYHSPKWGLQILIESFLDKMYILYVLILNIEKIPFFSPKYVWYEIIGSGKSFP